MMIGILSVVAGLAICFAGHLMYPTEFTGRPLKSALMSGIITGVGIMFVAAPIGILLSNTLKSWGVLG